MATKPGLFTDWPWKHLGSFKYMVLAPFAIHSLYRVARKGNDEIDYTNLLIIPFLLSRALHNQLWISYSRYRTAKGTNRIVDRTIEFEQVDREENWEDQILLSGVVLYVLNITMAGASFLPLWKTDGVIITILSHSGPVEYLYYWLHRALHHHYLYSRYHSHHHSSIVTEPITSVIHPFAEIISYFVLFFIPVVATVITGTASLVSLFGYITYIDLMNNMGHCNFEIFPKWVFSIFPPLKYLMYTPSFHSLHHTQFRTNYCLFMPFYDYIHGTMDKSSDALHESSLEKKDDVPDVIHLTHLTTPESMLHLPIGLASFASRPLNYYSSKWLAWPLIWLNSLIYGPSFVVERNVFEKLKLQSWVIPRYSMQYTLKWNGQAIKKSIEKAILEAEARGAKVMSLGLLNQSEELSKSVVMFLERRAEVNLKVVDGSGLAVAIVLNTIPKGTTSVLFRGRLSKLAYAIVSALCNQGIQVATLYEHEKLQLSSRCSSDEVVVAEDYSNYKIWLIDDGLSESEQLKAPKGTLFIPFSHFPPKKFRIDAFYFHTPSMVAPPSLHNLNSCENWLPRRVMSASRVAGIVHGLEEWNENECGDSIFDSTKIWEAARNHGFRPTTMFG